MWHTNDGALVVERRLKRIKSRIRYKPPNFSVCEIFQRFIPDNLCAIWMVVDGWWVVVVTAGWHEIYLHLSIGWQILQIFYWGSPVNHSNSAVREKIERRSYDWWVKNGNKEFKLKCKKKFWISKESNSKRGLIKNCEPINLIEANYHLY